MATQTKNVVKPQTAETTNVINAETAATNGLDANNGSEQQPDAETPKTEIAPLPENDSDFTSDKLIELRKQRLDFKLLARTFEPDSDAENDALMNAYKIEQQIKTEIATIKTEHAKMVLDAERNKRVALNTKQFVILFGSDDLFKQYLNGLTAEQRAEFTTANEIVNNELLSKFGKSVTSKPTTGTTTAGQTADGANKSDIVTQHIQNVANGLSDSDSRKQIEKLGFARSTVWHAVNNYNLSKK